MPRTGLSECRRYWTGRHAGVPCTAETQVHSTVSFMSLQALSRRRKSNRRRLLLFYGRDYVVYCSSLLLVGFGRCTGYPYPVLSLRIISSSGIVVDTM